MTTEAEAVRRTHQNEVRMTRSMDSLSLGADSAQASD
jgi:hypothetical protein